MTFDRLEALTAKKAAEATKVLRRDIEPWEIYIFIHESEWQEVVNTMPHSRSIEVLGIMGDPLNFCRHPVFLLKDPQPAFVMIGARLPPAF